MRNPLMGKVIVLIAGLAISGCYSEDERQEALEERQSEVVFTHDGASKDRNVEQIRSQNWRAVGELPDEAQAARRHQMALAANSSALLS